jgi:hypothetical protein
MSLIISPTINNNNATNVSYIVFNSINYSYVKHISFSKNIHSSFIESIKMHGIKINGNFIDEISEIICDKNPVISDFIESHWENNYILVIINNIVIYPCMNKDEFNLDTSAEIIDYIQSIRVVYKDKFNTDLVFPNQFYGDSWRKRIDALFVKNITIQIRDLITNFKNLYNRRIQNGKIDSEKNKNDLTIYFNKNIIKICNEIRALFQLKDRNNNELFFLLEKFINYVKYIFHKENKDLKATNEENKKNIINLNNKLFFQKIMDLSCTSPCSCSF